MVILVTSDGLVREEMVRLEDPLAAREVEKVLHILNQKFSGRTLTDIREALLHEADESRRLRLTLVQAALDLIDHALRATGESVYLEGASRLIEQPEFRAPELAGRVLRLVDERLPLARLLGRQRAAPGLTVEIGREMAEDGLSDFSVVHVPYRLGVRVVGALAVLGPTRMQYEHVSPLLEKVARLVEARLNEDRE
jgi:heat-inducible transcriptional repressor